MADKSFKVRNSLNLEPQASAPTNPTLGDCYVDLSGAFFRYDGATWTGLGGSGEGTAVAVNQASHGFTTVGTVIKSAGTANTYTLAQADDADSAEVVGVISAIADTNNFTYITGGKITGLSGLTTGTVYFLSASSAGAYTDTEPSVVGQISKPVLLAISTTSALVLNMRGTTVGGTNLYSTIGLANSASTTFHTINCDTGSGGILSGTIRIDATTDYAIPFICMFSRPASGTYNVATQFGSDVPPAASGVSFGITNSGSAIQVVMPAVTGFSAADVTYCVQAAANGTTLPVSVSASSVLGSTTGVAPAAGVIGESIVFDYLTPALGSAGTQTNVYSKTLTAGRWEIIAPIAINIGTTGVPNPDNYMGASVSTVSGTIHPTSEGVNSLAPQGSNGSRTATGYRILDLNASTTIYIVGRHGIGTAGNAAYDNTFATPFAIRIG